MMTRPNSRRAATAAGTALLLAVLGSAGCTAARTPPAPPSDAALAAAPARPALSREQVYFVLPDRFANGDPGNDTGGLGADRMVSGYDPTDSGFFHGGDLAGVISHLDYIKGLGTTALWLAPVFTNRPVQGNSAGYHGYWITDFTQIDPHFGSTDQLVALVDLAHRRGMKVFLDIVVNHTADVIVAAGPYQAKATAPYLDAAGKPFDDATVTTFPTVDANSFPYPPAFATPADAHVKKPDWLNDPTMYHNRGDSTYTGESTQYGDIAGLDDLWTERPEVRAGMTAIYRDWIDKSHVDGFRIDTVKHVETGFWQRFIPAVSAGHAGFFTFGEVYDANPAADAGYVTQGGLSSTLDFPFQAAARAYVSQGAPPAALAAVYAADPLYTSAHSNAYSLATFLGNHDMGRIGAFIAQENPGAGAAELLRRDILAHELMFLTRGQPVVYYGDEQGFTGPGAGEVGDRAARQDMFASHTPAYLADTQLGTTRTDATDEFDPSHPLYQAIAALSALTKRYPALRDGAQSVRFTATSAGVFAVSRTGPDGVEFLVAFNNDTRPHTENVPSYAAGTGFHPVYGSPGVAVGGAVRANPDGTVPVTVPALSTVVLAADAPVAVPAQPPTLSLAQPRIDPLTGVATITATVDPAGSAGAAGPGRVTFAVQVGTGPWVVLGTADAGPYQVTQDLSGVPAGTPVRYRAVLRDQAGRLAGAGYTLTAPAPR